MLAYVYDLIHVQVHTALLSRKCHQIYKFQTFPKPYRNIITRRCLKYFYLKCPDDQTLGDIFTILFSFNSLRINFLKKKTTKKPNRLC